MFASSCCFLANTYVLASVGAHAIPVYLSPFLPFPSGICECDADDLETPRMQIKLESVIIHVLDRG